MVYDGGFRVPSDLHDRLLDFQKTGHPLGTHLHAMECWIFCDNARFKFEFTMKAAWAGEKILWVASSMC